MRRCLLWPHVPGARVSIWKLLFINSSTWWLYYPSGCLLSLRHWGSNRWGAVRYADINIGRSTFSEYQTDSLLHLLLLQPSVLTVPSLRSDPHDTAFSSKTFSPSLQFWKKMIINQRTQEREKKSHLCSVCLEHTAPVESSLWRGFPAEDAVTR